MNLQLIANEENQDRAQKGRNDGQAHRQATSSAFDQTLSAANVPPLPDAVIEAAIRSHISIAMSTSASSELIERSKEWLRTHGQYPTVAAWLETHVSLCE
jgi:hypothetical protein